MPNRLYQGRGLNEQDMFMDEAEQRRRRLRRIIFTAAAVAAVLAAVAGIYF